MSVESYITSDVLPHTQPELINAIVRYMDKHLAIGYLTFAIENPAHPSLKPQYEAARKQVVDKTSLFDLRRKYSTATTDDEKAVEDFNLGGAEDYAASTLRSIARNCQCLVEAFFFPPGKREDPKTKEMTEFKEYSFRHTFKDMEEWSKQAKFSLKSLKASHGVTERHIQELATFAHHLYDCGRYKEAHIMLDLYKRCTSPKFQRRDAQLRAASGEDDEEDFVQYASPNPRAMWGRFACAILLNHRETARDAASDLINRFDGDDGNVAQNHLWFVHWHLAMLTMERSGTTDLLRLMHRDNKSHGFLKFRYTNTVLCACPHLIPYLVALSVINKSNSQMVQRTARVVDTERHRVRDPLSKFLITLRLDCDFDAANALIPECVAFMEKDYFLHKRAQEFKEVAELMVVQNKLWVHKNMATDQVGEEQLVRLIREAGVDATIDSVNKTVTVHTLSQRTVWKQVLDTLSYVSVQ